MRTHQYVQTVSSWGDVYNSMPWSLCLLPSVWVPLDLRVYALCSSVCDFPSDGKTAGCGFPRSRPLGGS